MYSTLLIINSKDRHQGSPGNFQYSLDLRGRVDIQGFRINKVTLPYSWYNIPEQQFIFNSNVILLPAGSYTIYTLIQRLQNLMRVYSPLLTITYDSDTNKITIEDDISFTVSFLEDLQIALGFITPFTGLIKTGEFVTNVNLTSNVYLSSAALTVYTNSFFNKKTANIFQSVPVNTNSFGYVIWQNSLETTFKIDSRNIQNIDLQVYDDEGNIIDFNNQNWILEIEIYSNNPFN